MTREREQGTFDQLLVTPLRPIEILLGKALPGFLIGFAEATLIIVVATLWFGIPLLGSLVALYVGLGVFLLSAVGVGLMISWLAVTQQQGLLGAFLFMWWGRFRHDTNLPIFAQYTAPQVPGRVILYEETPDQRA